MAEPNQKLWPQLMPMLLFLGAKTTQSSLPSWAMASALVPAQSVVVKEAMLPKVPVSFLRRSRIGMSLVGKARAPVRRKRRGVSESCILEMGRMGGRFRFVGRCSCGFGALVMLGRLGVIKEMFLRV